ncbi:MAG: SIS domain-containing protein [Chloroflexota bacterium]|nr:SIS domain-containing protein [Chloroflexota bacterium]
MSFKKSIEVKQRILADDSLISEISHVAEAIISSLKKGGKIIFCGNGGSFADAQHLSAEFTSRFMFDRPSLPALALGTNSSAMSAVANDYGYDQVFSRELSSIGTSDDVIIGISTSGKSVNVLKALGTALEKGSYSALLTGGNSEISKSLDGVRILQVPSLETATIQESHIMIGHILCEIAESAIFNSDRKD